MFIDDLKLKIEEQRAMMKLVEADDYDGSSEVLIKTTRSAIENLQMALVDLEWLNDYHTKRLEALKVKAEEPDDDWERREAQERDDEHYAYLAEDY